MSLSTKERESLGEMIEEKIKLALSDWINSEEETERREFTKQMQRCHLRLLTIMNGILIGAGGTIAYGILYNMPLILKFFDKAK